MTELRISGAVVPENHAADLVNRTLAETGKSLDAVEISFVSPTEIRAANRQYRQKDVETDVLSFPFDDTFPQGDGGELLIAPVVAARNAKAEGRPLAEELDLLVVHGTLHLAGYEDETEAGRGAMDRLTTRILGRVHG